MMRWVGGWLTVAVLFALAALLAGPLAQAVAIGLVSDGDYRPCPAPRGWEHRPPLRWVRADGRCP